MDNTFVSTATIRQRGQLTIPDTLRKNVDWLNKDSVVTVTADSPEQITIRPYDKTKKEKPDWGKILRLIRLSRSFKGNTKGQKSLSQFIIEDRERH